MFSSSGGSSSNAPSPAMEGTPSSGGGGGGGPHVSYLQQPQQFDSNPYDHWASPAEVAEMRSMWASVLARHKSDIATRDNQIVTLSQERDGLLEEVRQTEELRRMYHRARVEYEQIKEERGRWDEERQILVLRLQKMKLELDAQRGGRGHLGGEGGSSVVTTIFSSDRTSFTASGPTTEELQYMEALYRQEQLLAELNNRFVFQSTTDEMRSQNQNSRILVLTAEIGLQRQRIGQMEVKSTEEVVNRELLESQLESARTTSAKSEHAAATAQQFAKSQLEQRDAAHAVRLADATAALEGKINDLERQLAAAVSDGAATRDKLTASLKYAQDAYTRHNEQLEQEISHLESDLGEVHDTRRQLEQKCADLSRSMQQQSEQTKDEIRSLSAAKAELLAQKQSLVMRLDSTMAEVQHARAVQDRLLSDGDKLVADHQGALRELSHCKSAIVAAESMKIKVGNLEAELAVQRDFYEKRLEECTAVTAQVQQRYEVEVRNWMAEAAKWQRKVGKYLAKQQRTKSAEKHPSATTEEGQKRSAKTAPAQDAGSTTTNTAAGATVDSKRPPVDAVELLKESAKLAAAVRGTIAK